MDLKGSTVWASGNITTGGTQFANSGTFEVKTAGYITGGKALDGQTDAKFTNSGIFTRTGPENGGPLSTLSIGMFFTNTTVGQVVVNVGQTEFKAEVEFAGTVVAGDNAMLIFAPAQNVTNLYSAATTMLPGSHVVFGAGATRFVANTNFSGDGMVGIGGATWELAVGVNVSVSNANVGWNPVTGVGSSTIFSQAMPTDPLPRLIVNSYISLEAFQTEKVYILIASGALGALAPLGVAEFSRTILKVEGTLVWEEGDVTLSNSSTIAVGAPAGAPQAEFVILANAIMRKANQQGNESRVVAYGNGWIGRSWAAPPGFTTFQVPLVEDPENPGTVDLTGIVFE
jgi:hypothetical protein